jgi:N-acetylglucosamine-6-phosphate deacetylase
MIVIRGGDLVLPERVMAGGSLIIDGPRIVALESGGVVDPAGARAIDARGCLVIPGFIDVHVHGVAGHDTLGAGDALESIARCLPRFGVTSFCPTSMACPPEVLRAFLDQVRRARQSRDRMAARVLRAHLESNFINPDYRGAQPLACLRVPGDDGGADSASVEAGRTFTGRQILEVIAEARAEVGLVTLAPELPGALELVRALTAAGHRVSLGHSGADFETAMAAIDGGARHATHLFNRMTPLSHRAPGLAGAVLGREEVAAELICDGYHVHPSICRLALAAKGPRAIMAITDGTAASALPVGATARLGDRVVRAGERAAFLDDGTLAGSTLTMDRAFGQIVTGLGRSVVDAALMCSTTPARELSLSGLGVLEEGARADIVLLDRQLAVVRTFIEGHEAYRAAAA